MAGLARFDELPAASSQPSCDSTLGSSAFAASFSSDDSTRVLDPPSAASFADAAFADTADYLYDQLAALKPWLAFYCRGAERIQHVTWPATR